MFSSVATFILFLQIVISCSQQLEPTSCMPGFVLVNTSASGSDPETACSCGEVWKRFKSSRTVRCKDGGADSEGYEVLTGSCVTYNASTNLLSIGACPYNLASRTLILTNLSELGDTMCAPYNRKGRMCQECMDGFWPSMARSMHCKQCNVKFAWLKYVFLQVLFPSSLLFIVIVICNVQFSSSPLGALILFCQVVYNSLYYDAGLHQYINHTSSATTVVMFRILMASYGIFNLDFHYVFKFRKFSQVCLSPSMKGVDVLMLKYFEAFIPLLLILAVSLCTYLHNKNCKPLVFAWRVILRMISTVCCFKHPAPPENTSSQRLCNAFTAFFILAYSKIFFVSLNFLIPNKTYDIKGDILTEHWSLYFDPTIEYFGREHIPYAVLAICVLCLFSLFPLLFLTLYLFKPLGSLYSRIFCSKWHVVNYFIDNFQGWYRNGTGDASRDYRLVFAVFPLIKILNAVWICVFTGMEYRGHRIFLVPSMFLQGTGLFYALFRPYRVESMNILDSLILWLLGTITYALVSSGEQVMHFTLALAYLPLLGVIVYAAYRFSSWGKRLLMENSRCCLRLRGRHTYPPLLSNDVLETRELKNGCENLY